MSQNRGGTACQSCGQKFYHIIAAHTAQDKKDFDHLKISLFTMAFIFCCQRTRKRTILADFPELSVSLKMF